MIATAGTRVLLSVAGKFSHQPLEWWVARMTKDRITPVTPEGEPFRWREEQAAELVRLIPNQAWPPGDVCVGADTPLVALDGTCVLARDLKADGGVRRIGSWGGDFRIGAVKQFVGRAYKINDMGSIGYLEVYGTQAADGDGVGTNSDRAPGEVAGPQDGSPAHRAPVFGQSAGVEKRKRGGRAKTNGGVRRDGDGSDQSLIQDQVVERSQSGDIYV